MTTQTNWQKFDKAFSQVSSYVILDKDTKNVIAKIALKYPKNGAGRVTCYMHLIGHEVQIGTASGYGYDKRSAAIIAANSKQKDVLSNAIKLHELLLSDQAQGGWQEVINENNGFIVIQAI